MTKTWHPAVVAPVAGFLLGALDFVWIKFVPFPFGELGNSLAVWAVAAFFLTWRARWGLPASVVTAAVLLVVAVPSYYLAATAIQGDDLANVWAPFSLLWMGFGVVAGVVFGAAGVLAREPGRLRDAALAMPGAVLFAEGVLRAGRSLPYVLVVVLLGLVTTLLIARRRAAIVVLYALPLTALGTVLLMGAGFR